MSLYSYGLVYFMPDSGQLSVLAAAKELSAIWT